jgi:hypothetical protein
MPCILSMPLAVVQHRGRDVVEPFSSFSVELTNTVHALGAVSVVELLETYFQVWPHLHCCAVMC